MQHSKPDSDKTPVVVVQRAAAASSCPLGFKGHFLLPSPQQITQNHCFSCTESKYLNTRPRKKDCVFKQSQNKHTAFMVFSRALQQKTSLVGDQDAKRPIRGSGTLLWFCLLITIMDTHTQPDNRSSSRGPLQQPLGETMEKHLFHGQFSLHNTTDSKRPSL